MEVLEQRHRERVMLGDEPPFLGVPGEQGEPDDPGVVERLGVVQPRARRPGGARRFESAWLVTAWVSATIRIRSPGLASNRSRSCLLGLGREELGGRAGQGVGLDLEPDQSLGAHAADELGQAVEVLAAVPRAPARGADPSDPVAVLLGLLEDLELGLPGDVGDVLQLQPVAQVGPVVAEPLHHVVVVEPGERELDILAGELPGHRGDQDLHRRGDVLVVDERHLDVELGELGLTVGAEVLVAEAAGDLEIAVEPRDHQELLVELGRLRQGVEVPGVEPAGDEEVARALGRAPAQDRRLDLEEAHVRHHRAA